jgi:hypothetical protein
VNARNVEAWAESVLLHEGFRSEPERKIVPRVSELGPEAAEKARLRDLIAELQRRAEETEDDDEAAALFRRRRSLIRTLREVEQEVPRVIFDVVRNTGRTIEQAWAESDTDGRREILLDRYGELSVEVSKARYPSQPAEQRVHVDDPAAHDDLVPLDG